MSDQFLQQLKSINANLEKMKNDLENISTSKDRQQQEKHLEERMNEVMRAIHEELEKLKSLG